VGWIQGAYVVSAICKMAWHSTFSLHVNIKSLAARIVFYREWHGEIYNSIIIQERKYIERIICLQVVSVGFSYHLLDWAMEQLYMNQVGNIKSLQVAHSKYLSLYKKGLLIRRGGCTSYSITERF
jgi:hypothetical protein